MAGQARAGVDRGARRYGYVAGSPRTPYPAVLDVDDEACALAIAAAPDELEDWKDDLLPGDADPAVGARLGTLLGTWHAGRRPTRGRRGASATTRRSSSCGSTRIPNVAERRPRSRRRSNAVVERDARPPGRLVHGDFSPKNVLVRAAGRRLWVIDFEVAHYGDPAFDLAFLLNHLLLKSIHRPAAPRRYRGRAPAFLVGVRRTDATRGSLGRRSYVLGHAGCLLLARVDGKSPAEYLTASGPRRRASASAPRCWRPRRPLEHAWTRWSAL